MDATMSNLSDSSTSKDSSNSTSNGSDSSTHTESSDSTISHDQDHRVKVFPLVLNGSSSSRRPPKNSHEAYPGYTHPQQHSINYVTESSRPLNPQSNYRGRDDLRGNHSDCIPVWESTSLWITKLPPHCDYKMLLGAIRGCSRVHETVINPPRPERGLTTAACKLVFFERHGADRLLAQSICGEFKIMGYAPTVTMNKILKKPQISSGYESRVLRISGPSFLVNTKFLTAFFQAHFDFNVEEIETLSCESQLYGQITHQEWRFGSYRNQAKVAYKRIESTQAEKRAEDAGSMASWMWSMVKVGYGLDPCGV